MLFDGIRDVIGHTPLVRLRVDGPEGVQVYAKLEMQNLFGMKDRVARNVIMAARRTGRLRDGDPIVESSSGTMALGVALVGRSLGHAVHIVTDPRIDRITMAKLRALGCEVHVVDAMTSHGWQSARIERLEQLLLELPGAFWPEQYSNPDNPGAYRELAEEIMADLGPIDVLVGSVGSGGSLCGSARVLRRLSPGLRVIGVDCVGSALFGQPDVPGRLQSGLGNSLLPANLDRRLIDEVHWLNDHEAFAATRDLAHDQQIFAGNTAGSVYRVLGDVAARAEPGTRIVGIFPDRGDRYADTVYDDGHWTGHDLAGMPKSAVAQPVGYRTVARTWSRAVTGNAPAGPAHLMFVESNTSGTGMIALRTAGELGLRPVLVTRDPTRYAGLRDTGCEVLSCDTNSEAGLRAAVQQRFRREEIAGVTTTSDFYVPAAAALAEWLGLPGNLVAATRTCRDKSALRIRLAEAGVRQPRYAIVTDAVSVAAAAARTGLPCVVKPADGSGSEDVLLCATVDEAAAHAARILSVRVNARDLPTAGVVLVEEYLPGAEFSVEMFHWGDGPPWTGVTAKAVTAGPHFVEHQHVFPAPVDPKLAGELVRTARSAVEAAGLRFGPSHTELRLTADGPAVIEVNPRLAGGMIPELVRLATGVDLVRQQLRVAAELPPVLVADRAWHAGVRFLLPDRPGELLAVEGVARAEEVEGVAQVTVTAAPGTTVRLPRNAFDRIGYVIASHQRAEEVERILELALGEIRVDVSEPVAARSVGG